MRKDLAGSVVGVVIAAGLGAVMLPIRAHLSTATPGLVLVVPVVIGVMTGGSVAGLASVLAGFLIYDFVFIPPYYALTVGTAQNWVALGVYVVVMLLVAQVVTRLQMARSEAQHRDAEARRLFELSELLVADRSVEELLETIVNAVLTAFDMAGVALLLPSDGHLLVAASSGTPLSAAELVQLAPESRRPVPVGTLQGLPGQLRAVSLAAAGRPVGILALRGIPSSEADRDLLRTFANHAALALERAQLRSSAMRSELLEEIDRVREALLGAVSHDLRTPLATMKVASSTLLDPDVKLGEDDVIELYGLIDTQTDRLTRLVTSLLDMTRYQAGVLTIHRTSCALLDLVGEAVAGLRALLGERSVEVDLPDDLPPVEADPVLIGQVLVNLIENADRHSPPGAPIRIRAVADGERILVSVSDQGPGVPDPERQAVFDSFVRFDTGGRSGLGLAIAKAFVEAHGELIWVEEMAGTGACFVFSLTRTPASGDGHRS
jgi:two-component system sensor histidine kinase KdpD